MTTQQPQPSRLHIKILPSTLLDWIERLENDPEQPIVCLAGSSQSGGDRDWLVSPYLAEYVSDDWELPSDSCQTLIVIGCRTASELVRLDNRAAILFGDWPDTRLLMGVGIGPLAGHLAACFVDGSEVRPLDSITVVGRETIEIHTGNGRAGSSSHVERRRLSLEDREQFGTEPSGKNGSNRHRPRDPMSMWGPTRAALGEVGWVRFRDQRFGVIGAGRMGSVIAEALYRNGANVSLFDRDTLEPHNVGESAVVTPIDVGQAKASVIAARLAALSEPESTSRVAGVVHSVLSLASLPNLKQCTFLVCTVDNPTARLITAFLSAIYLIPMLDLGTGIFHPASTDAPSSSVDESTAIDTHRDREMGADIRLCVPGRCLVCCGGIQGLDQGLVELERLIAGTVNWQRGSVAWFRQRGGSLRSLNGLAVNFGLRRIEDWLAGLAESSHCFWTHLEFDATGTPEVQARTFALESPPTCPLCRLGGSGDAALSRLPRLLRELAAFDRTRR